MNIVKTDRKIDWLSITLKGNRKWQNFLPFRTLKLTGKGRHGYGQSWHDKETGATIECAANREDMGVHFTLSGDVLQAMRDEFGMTDDGLVKHIADWEGQCSRIDLAIDIFGANFGPKRLNAALRDGSAKIPARKWRYIDGVNLGVQGATVDTGSQKSDKRFRCYDKRAEQAIKDGEAWVRLELQLRRMYARAAIHSCLENGCCGTIGGAIGAYLKWSCTDYQSALADSTPYSEVISRSETNRRKWLLSQVAKALASETYDDAEFMLKFMTAVGNFEDEYRKRDIHADLDHKEKSE